jgi:ABC-2 type transport system permease protein
MIRKEIIHITRDKRTLALTILMPALILLILGYSVANEIEDMPMAVADFSKTSQSREFIERFTNSGYFIITQYVHSESEILELMDENVISNALFIPEDFGRNISTGNASVVQFYINGANTLEAQTAQLAAETLSQTASQEILIQKIGGNQQTSGFQLPIDTRIKYLYNPDMRRLNYMIPGLIAILLQVQSLNLTSLSIVREREQGTMEQLIATPIKAWELMLGKMLPYVIIALSNILVTLTIGVFWFKVPVAGSVALLMSLSLIFILGSLGLGILVSNIAKTQIQAMYINAFVIQTPSMILSGFTFPRLNMPKVIYFAGDLLPITHFLEIARGIILKGVGFVELWRYIWPLALLSIIFITISIITFRKRIA